MRRWLLLLLCLLAQAVAAATVVDDRGVAVTLASPPQRIVTLLPSLTETVCELGACGRLVGIDDYSNWPAQAARLPKVGGVDDANIERIVSLRPDLVLASATSRAAPRLQALGIPVAGFELKTLADVQRVTAKVGQALGVAGADRLWARLNEGIGTAAARRLPAALRGTTVYFEVDAGGYAASESSHIGEILRLVGAVNVVPASLGSVPRLNPEYVVRADPQVIMTSVYGAAELPHRPGWQRIRAVRDGRMCAFSAVQGDVITRPGPRLAEAADLIVRCLAGEWKAGA